MNAGTATSSNQFLDELLGDFLDESAELLEKLNQNLLYLDEWAEGRDDPSEKCDGELLNEMFRSAHSLKGLAGMLGFDNITGLTHKVENVFDAARNDQLSIESQMIELMFQAVDRLEAMVACIKNSSDEEVDCLVVLGGIQSLLEETGTERPTTAQGAADDFFNDNSCNASSAPANVPNDANADPNTLAAENPAADDSSADATPTKKTEATASSIKNDAIPADLRDSPALTQPASPQGNASKKPAAEKTGAKAVETLRVDVERLDRLMNLAGQLVNNKVRFARIGDAIKNATVTRKGVQSLKKMRGSLAEVVLEVGAPEETRSDMGNMDVIRRHVREMQSHLEILNTEFERISSIRATYADLNQAVHDLDRVSGGIQKTVMDARMVPVGPLFSRFRRVVRDISRSASKEIELVIRGQNTELDKRMIDELADPLTHMVRNSADHGIESPDARLDVGKPALGTITLDAFHRGNSIVIQVTDDGKGLDLKRIREKAIEKGLCSRDALESMTDHETLQMIWEPGFSTAESITNVSGRGMGMDIVRSKIEALSGSVELESTPGAGAVFTIKLPLTMAIMPCLLVEIDADVFAIPIESVVEIVRVKGRDVTTVHGKRTVCVRGEPLSLVDLEELFRWSQREKTGRSGHRDDDPAVVIIRDENRQIGLIVNELLGEDEVVVKSLGENYHDIPGVCGANIMGDGRISLILDVCALIETSSRKLCVK